MKQRGKIMTVARRAMAAPMVHFVALGACLFLVYGIVGPRRGAAQSRHRIVIPPAGAEQYVEDEVLYREAVALGLHRDDPMVRRRMIQKMRFLLEDTAPVPPPSDAQLTAFMDAHPSKFRIEPTLDVEQLFFSRDRRGGQVTADASAALVAVRKGETVSSDAFVHGRVLRGRTHRQLVAAFGDDFARAVRGASIGSWIGPLRSSYGMHLVRVTARAAGAMPDLDRVRSRVRAEYLRDARARAVRRAIEALRSRYQVEGTPKS
jgi:hypothetical protein